MLTRRRSQIVAVVGAVLVAPYAIYWGLTYDSRDFTYGSLERNPFSDLSGDHPQVAIAELFPGDWDRFCFVPSYYSLDNEPELADLDIPWQHEDGDGTFVLLAPDQVTILKAEHYDPQEPVLNEVCFDAGNASVRFVELNEYKTSDISSAYRKVLEVVH